MTLLSLALSGLALALPFVDGADSPAFAQSLSALSARELGPARMGGRISHIAVFEREPRIFFVASASGGLWKTQNAGLTFESIGPEDGSMAFGVVSVNQSDANDLWIGTGEQNSRNSVSWGDGVYRSRDGGKTWKRLGLTESRHIGAIALHPSSPDVAFVAAMGNLWAAGGQRGVFRTMDGGQTWQQVLALDDRTGVVDVDIDPSNPKVILAAAYERLRTPFSFRSGGAGSGLYRSSDGGASWRKVSRGIPAGPIGRIGVDFFPNTGSVRRPGLVVATIEAPAGGTFLSEDSGASWRRTSSFNPRPFYFSTPKFDPNDPKRIFVPAMNLSVSEDSGQTFRDTNAALHPDHHALWIDPRDSLHMLIGNDGGASQTRDGGKNWEFLGSIPLGQFYAVAVDMRTPYWVYGGLQDNGTWGGPTQTNRGGVFANDWISVAGGDGFHIQVDPQDWATVYAESQGGSATRLNLRTGQSSFVRPREAGARFNWSTPILLSPHNSNIVYIGSNKLYRSLDRGASWQAISPDLTTDDPRFQRLGSGPSPESTGAENHSTIITLAESPRTPGELWVGTDDGRLQLSRDFGATWASVLPPQELVPPGTWVSRAMPSGHQDGRAYVAFDGHRSGDFRPYLLQTDDFGKTWKSLASGLPLEACVYSLAEGRSNAKLLFAGTERGLWASPDQGATWTRFESKTWPSMVRVDDLFIHPRDGDLVIGTHGRSIWTVPILPLEHLTEERRATAAVLCPPQSVIQLRSGRGGFGSASQGVTMMSLSKTAVPTTLNQASLKTRIQVKHFGRYQSWGR